MAAEGRPTELFSRCARPIIAQTYPGTGLTLNSRTTRGFLIALVTPTTVSFPRKSWNMSPNRRRICESSYRALRPGGTLVLSTHGMFEEHGCPDDYWRWTGFGLRRAVEDAGFQVDTIKKITTGPRAILSLSEPLLWSVRFSGGLRARLIDIALRAGRRVGPIRVHKTADALLANHRVVDVTEPAHSTYVGLALRAFKGGTV